MTLFQEVVRWKVERVKAVPARVMIIDKQIALVEPKLSHEEAVFIVKKYEM